LKIKGKVVSTDVVYKVMAFLIMYLVFFCIGVFLLTLVGLDMVSAMGGVATSMGGIGPGLGSVGPMNNFLEVPDLGKWVLSFLMLLGRLELFSVLILLSPDFWKNH